MSVAESDTLAETGREWSHTGCTTLGVRRSSQSEWDTWHPQTCVVGPKLRCVPGADGWAPSHGSCRPEESVGTLTCTHMDGLTLTHTGVCVRVQRELSAIQLQVPWLASLGAEGTAKSGQWVPPTHPPWEPHPLAAPGLLAICLPTETAPPTPAGLCHPYKSPSGPRKPGAQGSVHALQPAFAASPTTAPGGCQPHSCPSVC